MPGAQRLRENSGADADAGTDSVTKNGALSGAGRYFKWKPNYSFEAIWSSA